MTIHGQSLHHHVNGTGCAQTVTPIVDGGKKRSLLIGIGSHQLGECSNSEDIGGDTLTTAENIDGLIAHAKQQILTAKGHGLFTNHIGDGLVLNVQAAEGLLVPCLGLSIGFRLAQRSLLLRQVPARPLLGGNHLPCIGTIDIGHEDTHRGAIIYNMVEIRKQIQATLCANDADTEQLVFQQVERLDKLGLQRLQLSLAHLFGGLRIDRIRRHHHRIALGVFLNTGLDKGMRTHHLFDSPGQPLLVDPSTYLQQNGIVIGSLSPPGHTLGIDTHLSL